MSACMSDAHYGRPLFFFVKMLVSRTTVIMRPHGLVNVDVPVAGALLAL